MIGKTKKKATSGPARARARHWVEYDHPIELIAIDIDGTLVRTDNRISAEVVAAVKEVVAAGVKVILATARVRL